MELVWSAGGSPEGILTNRETFFSEVLTLVIQRVTMTLRHAPLTGSPAFLVSVRPEVQVAMRTSLNSLKWNYVPDYIGKYSRSS